MHDKSISQRLAFGISAAQYLDFMPSVTQPELGYQVFCDYLGRNSQSVDCRSNSTPYIVSVNSFYELEMTELLKRIVDATAESSIHPFIEKGMSLLGEHPAICITDLDMERWGDILKQGGLHGEYACNVIDLSKSILREAQNTLVSQLVVPLILDSEHPKTEVDRKWVGVYWEEIEGVLSALEEPVDEKMLLASYGLQLWDPVAHHSLDEISDFLGTQSRVLYNAVLQVYAHHSMECLAFEDDALSGTSVELPGEISTCKP